MRNNSAQSRGFTLIELLIVIALLGALAVGLLATIDPFEQLKKGRDTSTRNTVSEFYNASLRYYSTKGAFPWGSSQAVTSVDKMSSSINLLMDAGELKANFMNLAGTGNLAKIFVTSGGAEDMHVCFKPESKGFQVDTNTIYDQTGGSGESCGSGSSICYYCIQ